MGAEAKRIRLSRPGAVTRKASSLHNVFDGQESTSRFFLEDGDNITSQTSEQAGEFGVGAAGVAGPMPGEVPFSITGKHIVGAVVAASAIGFGGFVSPAIPIAAAAVAVVITLIVGLRGSVD